MAHDYDWLVIGSGFGGSVSALRLREKGYSVGVLECGRRFGDDDFPRSTWDLRRYFWAPRLGMRGIFRLSTFKDVAIVSGAGRRRRLARLREHALPRAPQRFYEDPQWAGLDDWEAALAPHYDEAERMLGVVAYDEDDPADDLLREFAREIGVEDTYAKTRVGVLLDGEPGETVPDPFFGGAGPDRDRLHALRALHGRLPARRQEHAGQELPVARRARGRRGPARSARSSTSSRSAPPTAPRATRSPPSIPARGCAAAAGRSPRAASSSRPARSAPTSCSPPASCTARCRALSRPPRRRSCARTPRRSSPSRCRQARRTSIERVAITGSIYPDPDTHIETVTYGDAADSMSALYTLLVGDGTRVTRPLKLARAAARHPLTFLQARSTRAAGRAARSSCS